FPRPRLHSPRIAVEMRDDVDEFAASYGVVNDMAMRAHPHCAFRNGNVARHRASGRHAAPADTSSESRRVRAEQALSHNRMNPIGADDDIGLDLAAVGKAHHPTAIALFDGDAAGSKTEIDRLERAAHDGEQVRAVHRQVGRAKHEPLRMDEMTRPLFQLRMIRKSDSDPRAITASSTPSTRSASRAL